MNTLHLNCAILLFGTLLSGCSQAPAAKTACPTEDVAHDDAQTPLTPENHRAATERAIVLLGVREHARGVYGDVIDAQIRVNPALAAYRDILERFVEKSMNWDVIGPKVTESYMEVLTQREAEELALFLGTPAGQKFSEAQPRLVQRMLALGETLLIEHQDELARAIAARNREIQGAKPSSKTLTD